MPSFKPLVCLLACLLCLSARADSTGPLVFCYEDQDSWPWVMLDGSGLNQALLSQLGKDLHLDIRQVPMPWRRCLDGLSRGTYDGAVAASFNPERQALGLYPGLKDGLPDRDYRLHDASYSLYRIKGSAADWDGQAFHGINGRVASLGGFSIIPTLLRHGLQVEETSRDPVALMRMLHSHRFDVAAMQTLRADKVLADHPDLAADIEKRPIPLEQKDYYLMLSHQRVQGSPELAQAIWDEVRRQRESDAHHQRLQHALGKAP
ncbi:substrate-binding periplasmic protein [Metapseudomonas otitidis]|uniref:substrate-binding periplasmic protein n=1 Tax=Metapseudomonas otitidis TaxID=319939 RepID=UPI0013F6252D|nr:transporter substrate-binding domain-containing protein [Pseudomonas otitidis]